MKIAIIDNYDSFTYNLAHLVRELGAEVNVLRNDQFRLEELEAYDKLLLSPGPGIPQEAGLLPEVIRMYAGRKPMLGVCLGHQAICAAYGATVTYAQHLMHGKQSLVALDLESPLFKDLPEQVQVARYHSLAADPVTLPDCLKVIAYTEDDDHEVMAVAHSSYPLYGVQFHPESVMTPQGMVMLRNFLAL